MQFLIDTGCTTNLLSRHIFDWLPQTVRATLQKDSGLDIRMADGITLKLYEVIKLPHRPADQALTVTFVSSRLEEGATFGKLFLVDHNF